MAKSVTDKLLDSAEHCLNDDRFLPVGFAFRTSNWSQNAQTRLFNIFAAYTIMMAEYYKSGTVPRELIAVGRACVDLKSVLDSHFGKQKTTEWTQPELPGMEWTAV